MTVVGKESVQVGGEVVESVHMQLRSEATGGGDATSQVDLWLHPETGLVLRRVAQVDASAPSPMGSASYRERYEIRLTSLRPVQT